MPLVNMKHMLEHAYRHGYAVGAFEVVNLEFVQGVVEAAERCRGPVILSVSAGSSEDVEMKLLAAETAARRAEVPVALHRDDAGDMEAAAHAIKHGCNGLTVVERADWREDLGAIVQVVDSAHDCGLSVEGQFGFAPEYADRGFGQTGAAEALDFAERTGVDCLAVCAGTVHFSRAGKRKIDWQGLRQLHKNLALPLAFRLGVPLSDDQIHRLLGFGVARIDDRTLTESVRQRLDACTAAAEGDYRAIAQRMRGAISEEVVWRMRRWGAAGRAAEVLDRCEPWLPVDHIVDCCSEDPGVPDDDSERRRGAELLSRVPGVRSVHTVRALDSDSAYRLSWVVRFCHRLACENAMRHPDFRALLAGRTPSPANGGTPGAGGRKPSAQDGDTGSKEWGGANPARRFGPGRPIYLGA